VFGTCKDLNSPAALAGGPRAVQLLLEEGTLPAAQSFAPALQEPRILLRVGHVLVRRLVRAPLRPAVDADARRCRRRRRRRRRMILGPSLLHRRFRRIRTGDAAAVDASLSLRPVSGVNSGQLYGASKKKVSWTRYPQQRSATFFIKVFTGTQQQLILNISTGLGDSMPP